MKPVLYRLLLMLGVFAFITITESPAEVRGVKRVGRSASSSTGVRISRSKSCLPSLAKASRISRATSCPQVLPSHHSNNHHTYSHYPSRFSSCYNHSPSRFSSHYSRSFNYTPIYRYSSITIQNRDLKPDKQLYMVEWADLAKTILLLPPKIIEVGTEFELPDKQVGTVIEFTNTKITLLVKKRLVLYPFKLKN